jgi:hypothetical protein
MWPPLWSSGQATDSEIRFLFPALPDFLRSSGSGMGSTQPREYNWGATWKKMQRFRFRKPKLLPWGDPPRWLRDTALPAKVVTNFADKWRSLGRYSSLADWGHGACLLLVLCTEFNLNPVIGLGPITANASAVLGPSNTGVVGSNPTRGMNICVFILCLCCPVCRPRPSKDCRAINNNNNHHHNIVGLWCHGYQGRILLQRMDEMHVSGYNKT